MSRIQRKNREAILAAALDLFSQHGFKGATLDQIAALSGLSKPNLLYYFASKEEIHRTLLLNLLQDWLAPLRDIAPEGEPMEEILDYMRKKLASAQSHPREARLFAGELLAGAPHIRPVVEKEIRALILAKAEVLNGWMERGLIARTDAVHLIFAVWALTQQFAELGLHYGLVLGESHSPINGAEAFLEQLLRRLLRPKPLW